MFWPLQICPAYMREAAQRNLCQFSWPRNWGIKRALASLNLWSHCDLTRPDSNFLMQGPLRPWSLSSYILDVELQWQLLNYTMCSSNYFRVLPCHQITLLQISFPPPGPTAMVAHGPGSWVLPSSRKLAIIILYIFVQKKLPYYFYSYLDGNFRDHKLRVPDYFRVSFSC